MHVFVTGGTGLIGSAVVAELLGNGHTVLALARSDASALAAEAAGAETAPRRSRRPEHPPRRRCSGRRGDPPGLRQRLQQRRRRRAGGRRGECRPGGPGRGAHSAAAAPSSRSRVRRTCRAASPPRPTRCRPTGRSAVAAARSWRSWTWPRAGSGAAAVRMPRTVHNEGKGGFAGMLTEIARRTRVSGYPGDGTQRWPAVHALDAAVLFRLALELAPAGTSWHAVADEGDAVRDIAAVIGRRLGLPVEAVPQETYGPLGPIFATDQPSSSTHTRKTLGWEPTHPSLLRGPGEHPALTSGCRAGR